MKKILIFTLTAIMLITSLFCVVGARDEDNYFYVWEFQETNKAYPVMYSMDDCIGLKHYYNSNNFDFTGYPSENSELQINIRCTSSGIKIDIFVITGSYPTYNYVLETGIYDDVGFVYNSGIDIIGFIDGVPQYVNSFKNISNNGTSGYVYLSSIDDMRESYYVSFPKSPEEFMNDGVVGTTIESIGSFVLGLGSAFVVAFESVFMLNGQLNSLSIFLLVLFGCALAYGCVRWITALFRKET